MEKITRLSPEQVNALIDLMGGPSKLYDLMGCARSTVNYWWGAGMNKYQVERLRKKAPKVWKRLIEMESTTIG